MRVKKLEIFGFKSFATRQSIVFGQGITGIVGPNGCGKSNVVDALRWVMGEQNARHLRGGNMQDIIFCGSEKKAPLGFAEVTLTIENNEQDAPLEYNHFTEIEISRRLYKTGESEYEINRQKSRLKDISDFFLGTGVGTKAYSIIEQGRVNDIISAKPSDRRLIIEEAAAITKYKTKKAAAERRMETTRSNLNRIIDIKNEIDKRVQSLLRDKEKLEKIQIVRNRIREIDLHLASHVLLSNFSLLSFLNSNKDRLEKELAQHQHESIIFTSQFDKILENYTNKHEEKRLLEDIENQHKNSLELLKKDLEYTKATLNDNSVLKTRIASQLEDILIRKVELETDIKRFGQEQKEYGERQSIIKDQLAEKKLSGQSVVEQRQDNLASEGTLQKKILEAATCAARLQTEISLLKDQDIQKQLDIKNSFAEIGIKNEELTLTQNRISILDNELSQANILKDEKQKSLAEYEQAIKEDREQAFLLRKQFRSAEENNITLKSRAQSLKEIDERCEWSESGIIDLLASDNKHLIKALIADIIQVKKGHEDIVEKCLSHLLDAAIISNNEDLNSIADFMKKKKAANASFLLLNNDEYKPNFFKPLGLINLSSLIEIPQVQFADVMSHFSTIYVADTLTIALEHWPAARMSLATIVALSGEMLLCDGRAVIIGNNSDKGVLRRKNEVLELKSKIEESDAAMNSFSQEINKNEQQSLELNRHKDNLLQELRPLALGIIRLEEGIKQKRAELTRLEGDVKKLTERNLSLTASAKNSDEKIAELSSKWAMTLDEHRNLEEALFAIKSEKEAVEKSYEAYLLEVKEIEINLMSLREKTSSIAMSATEAEKNLNHLLSQEENFTSQIEGMAKEQLRLLENERQINKKIASLVVELAETSKMLATVLQTCQGLSSQKLEKEQELGQCKQLIHRLTENLHKELLKINSANNDINNLTDRMKDRYGVRLSDCLFDFHHQKIDEPAAKKEMEELIKQRDRIGSVNENALQEFDEYNSRSLFLKAQVEDLNDALNQLESAIKKINKTTQMRFLEAFTSINKQFSLVFPRLFNGGKAELILSNEEDLLNSGVEIMAKPPGKNIGSIELMSGGEKALTAIALIMAIFLIKPSPFCLLDEVDAPLDEANVSRFSQLIKEMSELSQFIVITHNRKTMECADQLYGVTMEDAGMSKMVSVHVQQAFEALRQPLSPSPKNPKPSQLSLDDF